MIYKESKEDLLRQALIKTCPVDWKVINNLMKRAYADLETAKRNIEDDPECAYNDKDCIGSGAKRNSGYNLFSRRKIHDRATVF
jgi:hypothetical protein